MTYTRVTHEYIPSKDFLLPPSKTYTRQYAPLYFSRLVRLREMVKKRIAKGQRIRERVIDAMQEEENMKEGEGVWIIAAHQNSSDFKNLLWVDRQLTHLHIGTVYIEAKLKPNILNDIGKQHNISAMPVPPKYYTDKDIASIEDESGRITLTGTAMDNMLLVTGIVLALYGRETEDGRFEVFKHLTPGIQDMSNDSQSSVEDIDGKDKWIALVSGCQTGGESEVLASLMLRDYLNGNFASTDQDVKECCNIVRIIFAGNTLPPPTRLDHDAAKKNKSMAKLYDTAPLKELDGILQAIVSSIPVSLLPGASDPANFSLPQQPLHHALFPRSGKNLALETNPYKAAIDHRSIMGNSGQPVDDIYRYVRCTDRLAIAESTLMWRHIAPTAPDTLWCYPFTESDPFILESIPDIYFVGNQPKFETKLIEGNNLKCRIVLLPKFCQTGTIVLVNIGTLEVKTIDLRTWEWQPPEVVQVDEEADLREYEKIMAEPGGFLGVEGADEFMD